MRWKISRTLSAACLIFQLLACIVPMIVLVAGCEKTEPESGPVYSNKGSSKEAKVYSLAVVPVYNPAKLLEVYQPIADGLNKRIANTPFRLETSRDFPDFEAKIRRRGPEILLPNHLQAIIAINSGYHVILKGSKPEMLKGIVIVRKDSGIGQPSDLKGKSVSYPAPTAILASIMTQYFLHRNGIDVNGDITNIYVGSMDSAIMNVFLQQTAAGGAYLPAWQVFQKDHPDEASQLKIIWETETLATIPILLRNDVPLDVQQQIVSYFTSLGETDEGREILKNVAVDAYFAASDMDFQAVRKIIADFQRDIRPIEGLE